MTEHPACPLLVGQASLPVRWGRCGQAGMPVLRPGRVRVRGLVLAALLALLLPAPAAAEVFGDLDIRRGPEPHGNHSHGYTEYRVTVTNTSKVRGHTLTLSIPDDETGRGRGVYLRRVSRTVEVGPGATVPVGLLVPD